MNMNWTEGTSGNCSIWPFDRNKLKGFLSPQPLYYGFNLFTEQVFKHFALLMKPFAGLGSGLGRKPLQPPSTNPARLQQMSLFITDYFCPQKTSLAVQSDIFNCNGPK